jgi:hypothetical protein
MSETDFKPMKPECVNIDNLSLSALKKLDNGATTMHVNYDESGSLYVLSPEVDLPFDGKFWPDGNSQGDTSGKWAIKANLKGDKCDPFVHKLKEMDEYLKAKALENSMPWFKKRNLSAETIDTLYTPMLKESLDPNTGEPDGKWPPSFTFKIVKRDSAVMCKIYKEKADEFNVSDNTKDDYVDLNTLIKKGTKVRLLLRCNGVWMANGKFGCTWRAVQMKVKPVATFDEYAFGDDDDDQEEVQKIDENLVESSDEDSSGSEEEKKSEPTRKVRKVKKASTGD